MANMANSWSNGHRGLDGDREDDEERLYTGARLGTTTDVQGDEEHGHTHHGRILVTKEFATRGGGPDSQ